MGTRKSRLMLDGTRHVGPWLFLLVACGYYLANRWASGPAYLADESGFLSNAAYLAGFGSDGASSYRAGYSLLLAPILRFAADPARAWTGVLLVNAALWGGATAFVHATLRRLMPDAPAWRRLAAIAVMALYPASVSMSGYAFSQTAFAFFFAAAVYALARRDRDGSVIPFSLLVGYLPWVHPVGLPVAIASVIVLGTDAFATRRWRDLLVHTIVVLTLVFGYSRVVEPWLLAGMTASGLVPQQNAVPLHRLLEMGRFGNNLKTALGLATGEITYLLTATLGFASVGAAAAVGSLRRRTPGSRMSALDSRVWLFCLLSILGSIAMASLAATAQGSIPRLDHWLYGRYVEPQLLLFLAAGLASPRQTRLAVGTAVLLTCAAFVLAVLVPAGLAVNEINVPTFWPRLVLPSAGLPTWTLIAAAVSLVAMMAPRSAALVLLAALYVMCCVRQAEWHQRILATHSRPSQFREFVALNYAPRQCVGFDATPVSQAPPGSSAAERVNLYSYYFYTHPLRRLTPQRWLAACEGPFLTFNAHLTTPDVVYVGREVNTGLFLVVRSRDLPVRFPPEEDDPAQLWNKTGKRDCLIAGCFGLHGAGLAKYSKVGRLESGELRTTGRAGYLFFGPYRRLEAGFYVLILRGQFPEVRSATLDIAGDQGRRVFAKLPLASAIVAPGTAEVSFRLSQAVNGLEVRVGVGNEDRMAIEGYEIALAPEQNAQPQRRMSLSYSGAALAALPRKIGRVTPEGVSNDGQAGFLLFGPYVPVPAGRYRLQVVGAAAGVGAGAADISSAKGRVHHGNFPLAASDGSTPLVDAVVELREPVEDLEVRVLVSRNARVLVHGYRLVPEAR